jgi:hypothetical protein
MQPTTADRFEPTSRTQVRRLPDRGVYDRAAVYAILDEALVCHVGIVTLGQPYVMPMVHARIGDRLFLHGAHASRLMRQIASGEPACITATLLDGLVLARSALHHSMNYRSVVILGRGQEVFDADEKNAALHALVERVIPGRWDAVRRPSVQELDGTCIVDFAIEECSAKVRTGPPRGDEKDHALAVWAGVIPLSMTAQTPVPDPSQTPGVPMPDHVANFRPRRTIA